MRNSAEKAGMAGIQLFSEVRRMSVTGRGNVELRMWMPYSHSLGGTILSGSSGSENVTSYGLIIQSVTSLSGKLLWCHLGFKLETNLNGK